MESRQTRKKIIERVMQEPLVDYELIHSHLDGSLYTVACKKAAEFCISSPELLKTCLEAPSDTEIQTEMDQVFGEMSANNVSWDKALDYHARGYSHVETIEMFKNEQLIKKQFGPVSVESFTGAWLRDYPRVKEHIESEQLLHVRGADENGIGLHWSTNKFRSKLNPSFNPEKAFEMRIGYFIVSPSNSIQMPSGSISKAVLKELEVKSMSGELLGYRFFVHPEAYTHFQALHTAGIPFVQSEQSEYIGTATSSYRSLILRNIGKNNEQKQPLPDTIPFIVKLGVTASNDNSRLLTGLEIYTSISNQVHFDSKKTHPHLWIFAETFGLTLDRVPNYPPAMNVCDVNPLDSGMIIREFPRDLLEGKCKIISFSSLMSVERLQHPANVLNDSEDCRLPLIYEIINAAIEKGTVQSTFEFIQKYLIDDVLRALEPVVFMDRLSLALHAQNLCLVLDNDNLPIGVAIRDHGDIRRTERYLETYTWFYRYHVFIKLLNVLTFSRDFYLPPIFGAPTQIGSNKPLKERSMHYYLQSKLAQASSTTRVAKTMLEKSSITFCEYEELLRILDGGFLNVLSKYFDPHQISKLQVAGTLPSAEVGSAKEKTLFEINQELMMSKREIPLSDYHPHPLIYE